MTSTNPTPTDSDEPNTEPVAHTVDGDDAHGYAILQWGVLMPDERHATREAAQAVADRLNDGDAEASDASLNEAVLFLNLYSTRMVAADLALAEHLENVDQLRTWREARYGWSGGSASDRVRALSAKVQEGWARLDVSTRAGDIANTDPELYRAYLDRRGDIAAIVDEVAAGMIAAHLGLDAFPAEEWAVVVNDAFDSYHATAELANGEADRLRKLDEHEDNVISVEPDDEQQTGGLEHLRADDKAVATYRVYASAFVVANLLDVTRYGKRRQYQTEHGGIWHHLGYDFYLAAADHGSSFLDHAPDLGDVLANRLDQAAEVFRGLDDTLRLQQVDETTAAL